MAEKTEQSKPTSQPSAAPVSKNPASSTSNAPAKKSSKPASAAAKTVKPKSEASPTPEEKPKVTPASPAVVSAAAPSVPDSTDKLVFLKRKTGKNQVALTYDDGPNPSLTPKLVEWLKANDVPATFFMNGNMVKQYPQMAKQVSDMGFELANHTYSHPDLKRRTADQVRDELQDTHDVIKEVTGVDVKLMRPPFGNYNDTVQEVCKRLGYKIINWDVDTNDWRGRSADAMVKTIMSTAGDGSIILMHDRKHRGRESVLETTQEVVKQLRAKGYTFVTVGELIGLKETSTAGPAVAAAPPASTTPAIVEPPPAETAPVTGTADTASTITLPAPILP